VTEEANQNLTHQQKILLKWHFRLGHIGFATVQWLGRNGLLGPFGQKMGAARLDAPKCAACQFGKQGHTLIPTHHSDKDAVGSLTKDKLEPGQQIFADQYESREPGRAFNSKGGSSAFKFGGGTLFIDTASNYISVHHQVGATANETIQAKIKFELAEKGHGITLSGVSAQFQNGAAENVIKIVVRNARTMMIHATLQWQGFFEKDLWPMALSHAAYLFNITPNMETGVSPISILTKTMQETTALRNTHTWGCPVYVLTSKLKDGQKIPKWEPRSHRGQYVGNSPLHASTVGLVRNLQTSSITPQFHLIYDDYFETVHSREDQEPANWGEILRFGRVQSEFNEGDVGPELPDEWLNPIEMAERTTRRQAKRDAILERQGAVMVPADQLQAPPTDLLALLTDVDTGIIDTLHPSMWQFAGCYKATAGKDLDLPTYREAMAGPDAEFYEEAMKLEIGELEDHGTLILLPKREVPQNSKVLPSTWVLRAKRYPDGRLRKHKARFCVRGDRQVEGVDYADKYSPVVSWSTVRMLLTLALKENLATRQVDFSNAFVQAHLNSNKHIYVQPLKGFEYENENGEQYVLTLKRSLYGLVQAPLYWGNHLKDALEKQALRQIICDPCMHSGNGVIVLTYVDDCLFFGKDQVTIDKKIRSIQESGLKLTVEDDIYAFLGVEVVRNDVGDIKLLQCGLIDKILSV
jgi:Reverse transcriptase (RNA-dependent DNA polymerase)/GAG-pre-integrase domain